MIATPALLLMLLVIVQLALWSHATHIAQAAATYGLAAARTFDSSATAGTAAAQELVDQLGAGPLRDTHITSDRTPTTATVQITAVTTSVVPLLTLPVRAEATGPVERFLPDTDTNVDVAAATGPRRIGGERR